MPDPFWDLVTMARRLQAPGGCAWDRRQTLQSLLPCLIEEAWETFEVVKSRRLRDLEEELGDVLYTVLFLALIAERQGVLRLRPLLRRVQRKMVRRHPHVFGAHAGGTAAEAYQSWQTSKRREGSKAHSPSRQLEATLVGLWEWLHAHPKAWEQPLRLVRRRGWVNAGNTPASGTPRPTRGRSRRPG
jgi:uncharacterized protein YabN with tetrapyrrole methylase and pyrophosphatase domain